MCPLTLLKAGKGQPSPKISVCHSTSSWEITALGARLAGVANPLHQDCPAQPNKAQSPLSCSRELGNDKQFLLRSPWAITFGVNSLTFRNRVGGAKHENAWGKEAHLHHISDHQDMLPGDCLWLLGYRIMICNIPKYSIKKRPQTETMPRSTNSDGRNRFSTPADFTPKPTSV